MKSLEDLLSDNKFWSSRYKNEGVLWGEQHSQTAEIASKHFPSGSQVLEIGCGYGRDLIFLAQEGFKVTGLDPSHEGILMAQSRMEKANLKAEGMFSEEFETAKLPLAGFDGVLSHRFIHLLTTVDAVNAFFKKLVSVTKPGAIICIGARNTRDLNTELMINKGDGIFEYRNRPGHRISYWDQKRFLEVFGSNFDALSFTEVTEQESKDNSDLCHLTVMLARKN